MTTRKIAEQYFEAWTARQFDRVRALMADDLRWRSPLNAFDRADDVMPGFRRFAESAKAVRLLKLVTEGDDAALLYEVDLPVGTIAMTTWLHIEGEKLRQVHVTFDATELRKGMA